MGDVDSLVLAIIAALIHQEQLCSENAIVDNETFHDLSEWGVMGRKESLQ